jgi:hypothetical protein
MPRISTDVHEIQLLSRDLRQFKMKSTKVFRDNARTRLIGPVVNEMKARFRAGSPHGKFVAPTIRGVYPTQGYPGIRIGGYGLGGTLFYGAEFGGGRRVRTYLTHSRTGTPYMVTRHTTRQFPRWYSEGRFIYPTMRARAPFILAEWARLTTVEFSKKGR